MNALDPNLIFTVCTYGVVPAWLLLIFLPNWKWTVNLVQYAWIPALLSLAYVLVFLTKPERVEGAGMGSLDALVLLLNNPHSTLLAWLHFLAFDLFVGAWIVRDSTRLSLHPAIIAPCLLMTFVFGPMGFLLYVAVRFAMRRTLTLRESVGSV